MVPHTCDYGRPSLRLLQKMAPLPGPDAGHIGREIWMLEVFLHVHPYMYLHLSDLAIDCINILDLFCMDCPPSLLLRSWQQTDYTERCKMRTPMSKVQGYGNNLGHRRVDCTPACPGCAAGLGSPWPTQRSPPKKQLQAWSWGVAFPRFPPRRLVPSD